MQGLRLQTSIQRADKGIEAFSRLQIGTLLGHPQHILATLIQCSPTLALAQAMMLRSLRQMGTTLLNCVMVAQMGGARRSLPGFFLWDRMEPRQWWGTTFLNSS